MFTASLAIMMRFPLDWGIVVRGAYMRARPPCPFAPAVMPPIHPTTLYYQTRFQTKQLTEYFSGSNAIGPYLIARFLADAPMGYGPFLMITLIYWMTGASGRERVA